MGTGMSHLLHQTRRCQNDNLHEDSPRPQIDPYYPIHRSAANAHLTSDDAHALSTGSKTRARAFSIPGFRRMAAYNARRSYGEGGWREAAAREGEARGLAPIARQDEILARRARLEEAADAIAEYLPHRPRRAAQVYAAVLAAISDLCTTARAARHTSACTTTTP